MASPSRLPAARRPAASSAKARPMSMFDVPTEHLRRLQQIGDGSGSGSEKSEGGATSKQSKRRSLLPTFSRRTPVEDERETVATIREDTSDSDVSVRPGTRDDTKSMPPPPKPSRPTSMKPPGAVAPARTTSLHAKTSSKDTNGMSKATGGTAITQKPDQGIKRSGSTKLPQGSKLAAPASNSTQQAIPTRGSSARATTSTTAQKRSSVIVSKPPTLEPTSGDVQSIPKGAPPSPARSTTSRPSTRSNAAAPTSKPSFSTYQQHYSPAKSALPKPGIPSGKPAAVARPPTASGREGEVPITAEVALEQIDLLQLSLLHRSSEQVLAEYEASARQKLAKQHARLRKEYESIRGHELEQRRLTNLSAIETWCPDHALLAEHLQTLNRVVTALRMHTEPGSRYSELSDTFDSWATKAEATLFDDTQAASFIEALPESWRAAHTSLALKLRSIQRDLDTLPPVPPPSSSDVQSSLEIIMDNCSSLVDDMLKSLEVMTKLQKEVLQRGKARIDEQINALMSTGQDAEKENWVPAWTSVS
ncbi:hypothetical protein M409DRAFT_17281 [Zasmidium cellare ATCC 36951]|uniref:Uncharacterized protein n=1 Tax=Zasmidium cellare ATCC 36951 TaxID=1080233 RepID=A0A6A6D1V4_ZASCE|nr:uncharacterized protein M409DRAFT_17281 [Zasmidium cellare ATCC 36951]KAF2173341.1 hypothetical protein M409DRAFT_17281 [Zasmidium cellare ATCC 36951]